MNRYFNHRHILLVISTVTTSVIFVQHSLVILNLSYFKYYVSACAPNCARRPRLFVIVTCNEPRPQSFNLQASKMSTGVGGCAHLAGSRLNLAYIWESSREELRTILGTSDTKKVR